MCLWDWRHVMSLTLKLSELEALDSTPFCPSCAAPQGEVSGGTEGIALCFPAAAGDVGVSLKAASVVSVLKVGGPRRLSWLVWICPEKPNVWLTIPSLPKTAGSPVFSPSHCPRFRLLRGPFGGQPWSLPAQPPLAQRARHSWLSLQDPAARSAWKGSLAALRLVFFFFLQNTLQLLTLPITD